MLSARLVLEQLVKRSTALRGRNGARDGQVLTLTASNSDTGNQQTIYTYGTTLTDSRIASSQLLRFVRYPDSDGTNGDFATYSYNRQGQQALVTDQRGCQP